MNHFIYPGLQRNVSTLVSSSFNVDTKELYSKTRKANIVQARFTIFLVMNLQGYKYKQIAMLFGYTHPNIMHGVKSIKNDLQTKPEIRNKVAAIIHNLNLIDAYNSLIQSLKKDFWLNQ